MQREYEVVYIFDSVLSDEQINEKLERFHGSLVGDGVGEVTAVNQWGRRQLAYPIRKKASGFYVVAQARTDPTVLPEFERLLKLDEELLRYLIVLNEGQPTEPMSLATRDPYEDSDQDDDEDEEE